MNAFCNWVKFRCANNAKTTRTDYVSIEYLLVVRPASLSFAVEALLHYLIIYLCSAHIYDDFFGANVRSVCVSFTLQQLGNHMKTNISGKLFIFFCHYLFIYCLCNILRVLLRQKPFLPKWNRRQPRDNRDNNDDAGLDDDDKRRNNRKKTLSVYEITCVLFGVPEQRTYMQKNNPCIYITRQLDIRCLLPTGKIRSFSFFSLLLFLRLFQRIMCQADGFFSVCLIIIIIVCVCKMRVELPTRHIISWYGLEMLCGAWFFLRNIYVWSA